MALLTLPRHIAIGTPAEMGRSQGEHFKGLIRAFVAERTRAARAYLRERGIRDDSALLALGRKCLTAYKAWDAEGHAEHLGIAEAAGVDAAELFTAGNYTDIRDILALPVAAADSEGCTAVLIPAAHSATREVLAAQTWDLNPGDLDFVVAVQRKPVQGPQTWSVTCAGCLSLIGMNQHGLAVGTTNLKAHGSRVGIPYLGILHRAIRCGTLKEAGAVIEGARRAAAHSYWVADRSSAAEWECTATSHLRREARDVPLVHTNHCLSAPHQAVEGEPASTSSRARLARMQVLVAGTRPGLDALKAAFTDRSDGVDSINRRPEDAQGTTTNACVVAVPARRELWACRGAADRGEWVRLGFGDSRA